MKAIIRLTAVIAAAVLLLGACGGDDDDSNAEGSGSGNTSEPISGSGNTSEPIKVMALLTVQSNIFGFPQAVAAIKAHASAINEEGGINGRRIEVTECNDKADPNEAAACARQAVEGDFAFVVGGVSLHGNQITDVLKAGNVAYVGQGPISPGDFTSPISFPVVGGTAAGYAGLGISFVDTQGCETIEVIVSDTAGAKQSADFFEQGIEHAGGTLKARQVTPSVNADYSQAVAAAKSDGADCVSINMPPQEAPKAITALRQGLPDAIIGGAGATIPPQLVEGLGAAAEGIVITDTLYPVSHTEEEGVAQFLAEMEKYASDHTPDSLALSSWAGMVAAVNVLKTMDGDIDHDTFLEAMNSADNVVTGVSAPVDFTEESPIPDFNRLFNTTYLIEEIENGGYKILSDGFQDAAEALGG